ncbi:MULTISPECIES: LysR family transcriptional regulator [Acinetobacter]|uniref:LysR family transcriptional regulator n=1 Tax=Acinetobacter colistiniresistens TaxID=280145 RepID=A0A558EZX5_9GAMM|nr:MULTISPECIES: LysR family transcriptional regulator [Acinetobacter]TVT78917.1 LysR family transcriptional regulator [Acinetobacter colistiniresistens]
MNQIVEMQTYIAVVEAGSITNAAKRLGITKSVVSQRIQQLEQRLSAALIHRGRSMLLTEAGQEFYQQSSKILAELSELEESISARHDHIGGSFRLSVPQAFNIQYLAPYLAEFMQLYPELKLDIESSDQFVNLNNGHYDAAIRMGELADSNLISQTVAQNHHYICASPDYLKEYGMPTHPNELLRHRGLLYLSREPHGMWQLPVGGKKAFFRISPYLRTDSGHQLLAAAKRGLGIAILPSFLAAEAICQKQLKVILSEFSPSGGNISVVYRLSNRASPKIQALVDFLSTKIGHPAPWDSQIQNMLRQES